MKISGKTIFAVFILTPLFMIYSDVAEAGWSEMDSRVTKHLYGIWGSSGSDVFVVGQLGTILHYDGSSWSSKDSKTTNTLKGVWGSSGSDIFAVGVDGTVVHSKGSVWSVMDLDNETTKSLYSVWVSPNKDAFVVGVSGTIVYYNEDDEVWDRMTSGTTKSLYDIWGSSGTDMFAVEYDGKILDYNGTYWSRMTSGTTVPLYGIWGSSGLDVFAVGEGGTVLHYDGNVSKTWTKMTSATSKTLQSVWGSSGSDVFAVGEEGRIVHYDGNDSKTWSIMDSGTTETLYGIWGSSGSDVFAVGSSGTILHYAVTLTTSTTTAVTITTSTTTALTSTTSTTTSVTPSTTTSVQSTTTISISDRKVDFVGSPTSGYRPLNVKFTSLCEGDISDYHWDFGDGSQTAGNPDPTHTYNKVGTYAVILTVTFGDGTEEALVEENYISVLPRFNCVFTSALTSKNDIRVLRNLRDSMPGNIYWFAIAAIYYSSSSEAASILRENPELKDRLSELVSADIEIAEELIAEGKAAVDKDFIEGIISFLDDLKSEGSPSLQENIDFVIRGIEKGYLMNGLGIAVE